MSVLRYRRVLLKISGEALMGDREYGLDSGVLERVAHEIKALIDAGAELCIVVGGGNIFRGIASASAGVERVTGDYMGMLATVMNGLALQSVLERFNVATRLQSAIQMDTICEPYIRRRAIRHMEKGRVVIFSAGTGSPFFTTDTVAALRASEMGCDALLKATKVDGIYSADPKKDPAAIHYPQIDYMDVLRQDLKVMDASAISLCRENKIPIVVFSMVKPGSFLAVMRGEAKHSVVANLAA